MCLDLYGRSSRSDTSQLGLLIFSSISYFSVESISSIKFLSF